MAASLPEVEDRYNLVSSLYGPGTLTAWYLTITSVVVSWAFHPRKRQSDSIDVDLIAVITLPVVAAAHLISQVQSLLKNVSSNVGDNLSDAQYVQLVAATEAAFNVTESFLTVAVILFMIAAWTFCIKRATSAFVTGLFCFAAECYVYFSSFNDLGLKYRPGMTDQQSPTFSRSFVADSPGLIMAILVTLLVCGIIGVAFTLIMLFQLKKSKDRSLQDNEQPRTIASRLRLPTRIEATALDPEQQVSADRYFRFVTVISLIFLPVALIVSLLPPILDTASHDVPVTAKLSLSQALERYASRLGKGLIPRSSCLINDLDQAVAASAGATGLGFRLYSAANEYYKIWEANSDFQSRRSTNR